MNPRMVEQSSMRTALDEIWKIVHTPTKKTKHSSAHDHFHSDFDAIRKIIASTLDLDAGLQS